MRIFGKDIKVVIGKIPDIVGADGLYLPEQSKIILDSSLKGEEQLQVLVHETLHSISDRLGWRQWLKEEMEELLCEQISIALTENFTMKLKVNSSGRTKNGRSV